jgi:hypothetical protein
MPRYHVTARVNHVYEFSFEADDEQDAIEQAEEMLAQDKADLRLEPDSAGWDTDRWEVERAGNAADEQTRPTQGFV